MTQNINGLTKHFLLAKSGALLLTNSEIPVLHGLIAGEQSYHTLLSSLRWTLSCSGELPPQFNHILTQDNLMKPRPQNYFHAHSSNSVEAGTK